MKGKLIGGLVFLGLMVSVAFAGVFQIAQGLDAARQPAGGEPLTALAGPPPESGEGSALYNAFVYVCPFH